MLSLTTSQTFYTKMIARPRGQSLERNVNRIMKVSHMSVARAPDSIYNLLKLPVDLRAVTYMRH